MTRPHLVILGCSEAAMFIRGMPPPRITAVISIHGQHEFGVDVDAPRRLDLTFDDVDVPEPFDVESIQRVTSRRRWAEVNGLREAAPTVADAASIIGFAEATREDDGILLCHCGGGMSRAPAAALICLAVWRGPGNEADCVAEVVRLRGGAMPHAGLVRFADELLGRDGRLTEALAASRRRQT